ncbi:UDP-N-acetylmuramate dehydrogenase [Humidisolicoccus flavus]|uniref:UDP-N-acetylmuramate dehydrogenase n=1 Tax=Humidisolicoccus flavus TaxID=3111414 RepID=UPI00324C1D86
MSTNGTMAFRSLTTMQVGGEIETFVRAETNEALCAAIAAAESRGEPWLVVGGGSNLIASDEPYRGTVIQLATRGIEVILAPAPERGAAVTAEPDRGLVTIKVAAGEDWDALVEYTVQQGWSGIEALSGIPGSSGASPIQNIGAYGQEVAAALVAIDLLDPESGEISRIPAAALQLGYRTSALKRGTLEGVVTAIELQLHAHDDGLSQSVAYQQLATALGVKLGSRVPIAAVRETVLALRAAKGMVLSEDPDSVSAGSFFTNPIVSARFARDLPDDAPKWSSSVEESPRVYPIDAVGDLAPLPQQGEPAVKLSAAWLIEHAGIPKGFSLPGSAAAVSSKHTLAITNRGRATSAEILQLAGYIQTRVENHFGVRLHPEPNLVGFSDEH